MVTSLPFVVSFLLGATPLFIRFYKKRKRGFVDHSIALPVMQRPYPFCGLLFSSLLIHPFAVANGCKKMLIKILGGDPRPQNVSTMTLQNVKKGWPSKPTKM